MRVTSRKRASTSTRVGAVLNPSTSCGWPRRNHGSDPVARSRARLPTRGVDAGLEDSEKAGAGGDGGREEIPAPALGELVEPEEVLGAPARDVAAANRHLIGGRSDLADPNRHLIGGRSSAVAPEGPRELGGGGGGGQVPTPLNAGLASGGDGGRGKFGDRLRRSAFALRSLCGTGAG